MHKCREKPILDKTILENNKLKLSANVFEYLENEWLNYVSII